MLKGSNSPVIPIPIIVGSGNLERLVFLFKILYFIFYWSQLSLKLCALVLLLFRAKFFTADCFACSLESQIKSKFI